MKDIQFAKAVVFVNGLIPGAMLAWDWYSDPAQLGVDSSNAVIHTTGMTALIFLLLTLAVTPVRKITGWNALSHFRRMLGLFAFFYATMHFLSYFDLDWGWGYRGVILDIFGNGQGRKPKLFILFGMSALLLMLPLAVTSFNGIIKRMGGKNWRRLHYLVYPAGVLAVIHFCQFGKIFNGTQILMTAILLVLLGYRVADKFIPGLRRKPIPMARRAAEKPGV